MKQEQPSQGAQPYDIAPQSNGGSASRDAALASGALDALPVPVALFDQRSSLLTVNRAWLMSTALRPVSGQIDAAALIVATGAAPEDTAALAAGVRAVAAGELPAVTREYRSRNAAGDRWLRARITRLDGESPARALLTCEDVTSARQAAEEHDRLAFLAEASALLSRSLDYETTLARIPSLAVPRMADWCTVSIVDGEPAMRSVAWAHSDPAQQAALERLVREYPPDPNWENHPIGIALRTGQSQLRATVSDGMLQAMATNPDHLALLRQLRPRSQMMVPLRARGQTLGLLAFVWAQPGKIYTADDLRFADQLAERAALAMDNARLFGAEQQARAAAEAAQQQARRQAERLQVVSEADRSFAEAGLDLPLALATVARQLSGLLGDMCVIRLLSEDGAWLLPGAMYHPDPDQLAFMREITEVTPQRAGEGLHGYVQQTGQPLLIPVVVPDDLPAETLRLHGPYREKYGMASVIAVPLQARGRVTGSIVLTRNAPGNPYTEDDLLFLQALADRAALAVENARLYSMAQLAEDNARQQARQTHALAETAQAFAEATLDVAAALDTLVQQSTSVLGGLSVLRLLSADGSSLQIAGVYHEDPAALDYLRELQGGTDDMPARAGLNGQVVTSGRPLVVQQVQFDELRPTLMQVYVPYHERFGLHSLMIVPLHVRGKITGTLGNFRSIPDRPYTDDDQVFLQTLADRAALAVENARLYADAERQRRRLEAVIEQTPEGVIILDAPDGRIAGWNRAALHTMLRMGISPELRLWDQQRFLRADGSLYPPEELPPLRALRTGEVIVGEEVTLTTEDGTRMVMLTSAAPILDQSGQASGAVLVFQDITERKTLEQLKNDFMSLVAHELRTPLTVMVGQTQLLNRWLRRLAPQRDAIIQTSGVDITRILTSLTDVQNGAQAMARLVSELLDLTRIETGRLALQPATTDLAALLRRVTEHQHQFHSGHIFSLEGAEQEVWGVWDAGRMEQVFTNLLENAAKYSAAGNRIVVRMTVEDGTVQVTVRDWGIGIPRDDLPHIFDRHYRAANVQRGNTGLGLGLYLTRELVERHGGSISAESTEGAGSLFTVRLPLHGNEP